MFSRPIWLVLRPFVSSDDRTRLGAALLPSKARPSWCHEYHGHTVHVPHGDDVPKLIRSSQRKGNLSALIEDA